MPATKPKETIQDAKLKVMEAVPYLQKTKVKNLNYTFAGEADLIAKLRPEMIKAGISVAPVKANFIESGEYTTSKGSRMVNLVGTMVFRFTHAPSLTHEDVEVFVEASDAGDKRSPKANTIGLKYALRQFFLIETGDDPDMEVHKRSILSEETMVNAKEYMDTAKNKEELAAFLTQTLNTNRLGLSVNQMEELRAYRRELEKRLES